MNVERIKELTTTINNAKLQEIDLVEEIKFNYSVVMNDLQASGSVVTKNVEIRYKEIERLFKVKQNLIELQASTLKEVHKELGII